VRAAGRFVGQVLSVMLLGTVVVGGLVLVAVPKATGSKPLTVLSGSMTPTYAPGDVVVVRPVDTTRLQIGDVITFQPETGNPALTTHRIIEVVLTGDGREYVTQGDANGAPDGAPVTPAQVRGKVWYFVPLVGYVTTWASGASLRTAIDVLAVLLVLYGGHLLAAGILDRRRGHAERTA
jgi:signal peptidase